MRSFDGAAGVTLLLLLQKRRDRDGGRTDERREEARRSTSSVHHLSSSLSSIVHGQKKKPPAARPVSRVCVASRVTCGLLPHSPLRAKSRAPLGPLATRRLGDHPRRDGPRTDRAARRARPPVPVQVQRGRHDLRNGAVQIGRRGEPRGPSSVRHRFVIGPSSVGAARRRGRRET